MITTICGALVFWALFTLVLFLTVFFGGSVIFLIKGYNKYKK